MVTLHDWGKIELLPPQCGMWNRHDVKRHRQLMEGATPSLPSMNAYNDVEPCYAAL